MVRVAVLGANGMLGHVVCRKLARRHHVVGLMRGSRQLHPASVASCEASFAVEDRVDCDDVRALHQRLDGIGPEVIVNCAGMIKQRPEAADPVLALRANALLPRHLARWCDRNAARLIHISTDCVFSGHRGNYAETDEPDPVDLYGLSKLLGEIDRAPHLTLRTSLIGPQHRGMEGLFAWFLAQRGRSVRGYARSVFSGLTTAASARILDRIIDEQCDLSGLFHVAAAPISKYDLLCGIERRLRLGIAIARDDTVICDRSLDGRRFAAVTGIAVPTWDAMLDELCAAVPLEPISGGVW